MGVKQRAVQQAILLLQSAGARYTIMDEDNKTFTSVAKIPTTSLKKEPKYRRSGINFAQIYLPVLGNMKAGQVGKVVCPAGVTAQQLRTVITSYVSAKWGRGTYITESVTLANGDAYVEVLRIEPPAAG